MRAVARQALIEVAFGLLGSVEQKAWAVQVAGVLGITILVALFCWGIRLLGNFEHRFRDLCTAGALSGPREELAILLLKRGIDNLIIVLKCSCTFRAERGIGNFNAKT